MARRRWSFLPHTKRLIKSPKFDIDEPILSLRALSVRDVLFDTLGKAEHDSFVLPRGSLRQQAADAAKKKLVRLLLGSD